MNVTRESEVRKTPQHELLAEHVRAQFEGLHRQPQLAIELSCFREGGELSSIHFMAHPHGLHVARWLKVLSHTQCKVIIETANPVPAFRGEFASARPLVPRFLQLPMTIRYLLAGIVARFSQSRSSNGLVHAHCASGNGFVAWLSGRRYLIGTYGSEIFEANQRGIVYRWLLKRILQGAERIADCSPECTKVLREQFQIPAEKIYSFHLGFDEARFHPLSHSERMRLRRHALLPEYEPIWVVNRRTDPHYRTLEVVAGFLNYGRVNSIGRLIVLCGDHQPHYTDTICKMVESDAQGFRVSIVKQMLAPDEFASWLQLSDYSISVPRTDNFSIAILESMGCGTVPILSNLPGYDELRACRPVRWIERFEPHDVAEAFADAAMAWKTGHQADRNDCTQFVQTHFSTEKAIHEIAAFYCGTPLQENQAARNAA